MSDKVKYGFFNLVDQDITDIVGANENANFPASNIKDTRSTKVYRSTTATDQVVFDFKNTENVDLIMIRPDLDSGFGFNGDLTLEANVHDEWSSAPYSTTILVNNELNLGIKVLSSAESYRFWRISGTGSAYFELSNIFIGVAFIPSKNVSFNWAYEDQDLSKTKENEEGQEFTDDHGNKRIISQSIKLLAKDERDLLEKNTDYIGTKKPFWMVMDNSEAFSVDKERLAGMFRLRNRPRFTNAVFNRFNTSFNIREMK